MSATSLPKKPVVPIGRGWAALALLIWGVVLAGVAIHAYLYPWSHTVYNIYAPATRSWWTGEDMYVRRLDYYRYSPLFAIALTPFAYLSDSWGGALWKVFNCSFFAASLWVWARRALPAQLSRSEAAALFLLGLPLSLHSIYNGQANLIMLGAILLAFAALATERWNQAAGWLAVATLIKGYPVALALILIEIYPRRLAARFATALGIGLLVPFALQWPTVVTAQYASWFSHMKDSTDINRERLRTVDALLQIYYRRLPGEVPIVLAVLAGGMVLGLCTLWLRRRVSRRQLLTEVYLLFAAWVILFGPATEPCTYVIVAPAVAWTLLQEFRRPQAGLARSVLLVSLLLMGPLVSDLVGSRVRNFATAHGSQPLGGLLFAGYLLCRILRNDCATEATKLGGHPGVDRAA
jgi:hypothetical protein